MEDLKDVLAGDPDSDWGRIQNRRYWGAYQVADYFGPIFQSHQGTNASVGETFELPRWKGNRTTQCGMGILTIVFEV